MTGRSRETVCRVGTPSLGIDPKCAGHVRYGRSPVAGRQKMLGQDLLEEPLIPTQDFRRKLRSVRDEGAVHRPPAPNHQSRVARHAPRTLAISKQMFANGCDRIAASN